MATCRSTTEQKTPRSRRRLVKAAKSVVAPTPAVFAIERSGYCVVSPGGAASVRSTISATFSDARGALPCLRVLSRRRSSMPSCAKRFRPAVVKRPRKIHPNAIQDSGTPHAPARAGCGQRETIRDSKILKIRTKKVCDRTMGADERRGMVPRGGANYSLKINDIGKSGTLHFVDPC